MRLHQFNTGDRDCCIAKPLEAQHRGNALLDVAMVLLNQVIEVVRRPQPGLRRQGTVGLQLTAGLFNIVRASPDTPR
jgi:hypothetical protein